MSSVKYKSLGVWGVLLVVIPLLAFSSCAGGGTEVGNVGSSGFKDSAQLEVYLKSQFAKSVLPSSAYQTKTTVPVFDNASSGQAGAISSGDANPSHSGTNIQEQGVDESDKVKTDGRHMFIAGNRKVSVVDVSDAADMKIKSDMEIDGEVGELYLYNGILAVLYDKGQPEVYMDFAMELEGPVRIGMPYWIPLKAKTNIAFYDVGVPSDPKLIKDVTIDGSLVSTRMIAGKLHLIQQYLPELPQLQVVYDGTEEEWKAVVQKNAEKIESMTLDDMLPGYSVCAASGTITQSGRLVAPQNFYKLNDVGGSAMVTISTFDLNHLDEAFKSVGVVATADTIYASTSALYLAASEWNYDDTYSENVQSTTNTGIHKFDLSGQSVRHVAGGSVKGMILNQFSMGEYQDVLRIATTEYRWNQADDSNAGTSNVYCLKNQNGDLKTIGRIENIAPGENMYSARFIGKRGFLVTYEQVDPLFTLDLSNPESPVVAGELKVPGYSEYIHPVDDNHLITIGRDIKEIEGRLVPQGVQLSLFDISDFANPRLLHKALIGGQGTYSEASYNHKAFSFWPEKSLLAIPVNLYESQPEAYYGDNTFNGLYVYHVTNESGFELKGRINTGTDPMYYYQDWTRGIFINQDVFAVQPEAVFSADTDRIEGSIKKLLLGNAAME